MRRELIRPGRHACRQCGRRHARFAYRGVVKWDREHELCFRCFRSLVDAQKARGLAATGAWVN
jgi:hypothetical protein